MDTGALIDCLALLLPVIKLEGDKYLIGSHMKAITMHEDEKKMQV